MRVTVTWRTRLEVPLAKRKKPKKPPYEADLTGTPFEEAELPSTALDDPKTAPEHMVGDDTEVDELSALKEPGQGGERGQLVAPTPGLPPEMDTDDIGERTPPPGAPVAPAGFLEPRELTPAAGSPTYPPHPIHPSQPGIPAYGYAPPPGPRRMSPTAAAFVLGIGSVVLTMSGLYAWDSGLFSDKPKAVPVAAKPAPSPEPKEEDAKPELLAAQPAFNPDVGPVRFSIVDDSTESGLKGLERGLFEGAELGLKSGTLAKLSEAHGGGSFVGALWLRGIEVKESKDKSTVTTTCQMALTPELGVEGTRKQEAKAVFEAPASAGDASAVAYLAAQNCGKVLIAQLDTELSGPPPGTADAGVDAGVVEKKPEPVKVKKKKRKRRRRKRRGKRRRRRSRRK